jgi:two-component system, chemotaxis family, sensor kinase CheA
MDLSEEQILNDFFIECHENLDRVDEMLVELEAAPDDRETLDGIFRSLHTIKGSSGLFDFQKVEKVTHAGENLLNMMREGQLALNPQIISALLKVVDLTREMIQSLEAGGGEGESHIEPLIDELKNLAAIGQTAQQETSTSQQENSASFGFFDEDENPQQTTSTEQRPNPPAFGFFDEHESGTSESVENPGFGFFDDEESSSAPKAKGVEKNLGDILVEEGEASEEAVKHAARQQADGDPRRIGEIMVDQGAIKPKAVLDALNKQNAKKTSVAESSIRVDVSLLDKLMDLVSELVLSRNQLLSYISLNSNDTQLNETAQQINMITTELQEKIMTTRMQPIANAWSKVPRVVRDLAVSVDKQITVEMEGKDTELDRSVIEAIRDPLTHMIRNSVDHGVESPQERVAKGKDAQGRIRLVAYQHSGQVHIEINDDGGGIDPQKIKNKAVSKGLISQETAGEMSDADAVRLIFAAGLSTAEKVTKISGRGVGMDVVKTNIKKIGGQVDVESTLGKGTTFLIRIPLTLAIVPGLMVTACHQQFAIPQSSLVELIRLTKEQVQTSIETAYDVPVYRLRGRLIAIVHLSELIGREHVETEVTNIVVLQANGVPFGLAVGSIDDTQEIVVKPLGKHLKRAKIFDGATITGDGSIALILDALGVAQKSGVLNDHSLSSGENADERNREDAKLSFEHLLILSGVDGGRLALPLSEVKRLEKVRRDKLEIVGRRKAIQYRGDILPVSYIEEVFSNEPTENQQRTSENDVLNMVVFLSQERRVGIVFEKIIDIVEETIEVRKPACREGIKEAAVIGGLITEVIDVPWLNQRLAEIFGSWKEGEVAA